MSSSHLDFLNIEKNTQTNLLSFIQNEKYSVQGCKILLVLPSFGSFGQAVSEEKIKKNRPIRNKTCLWRPYLLLDRDEMSNLYRGPSIDASYQVSADWPIFFNLLL
jgi:hypothetical protein